MVRTSYRTAGAAVLLAGALAASGARASDLALKRVMLSTGGVGYLEYAAEATGPATLGLDVPLARVDDVLKSIIVIDTEGGVGGIELPGQDGGRAAFGDVPFGPDALASPTDYLNALRGVVVSVTGARPMTGRIVHAESVTEPVTGPGVPVATAPRTRVTLMAEDGLRQFVLEDAEAVQVADPDLRGRITQALAASQRDSSGDMRHITVHSLGTGARTVRVGYVAGAPLWKTTYRLVLPAAGDANARLQGWAVLENQSGQDWRGVALALQYGNPVTFRQAIYQSYYVDRPEVPVEVLGRLLPGVDTGAVALPPPPAPAPAAMSADALERALGGGMRGIAPMKMATPSAPAATAADMAAPAELTEATEGAEETIFTLANPVDLAAGHTASVPILDRPVPAERVGLVAFDKPHPVAAVRLTNDTGSSLPAGVLTLYDPTGSAAFAGDARLGGLPAGERRLLSFAEDLRTAVIWRHADAATTLTGLAAADGVARLTQRQRQTVVIMLRGPAAEARTLLIEIPRSLGETLVPDAAVAAVEETADAWRLTVKLAPGEARTLTVHADTQTREEFALIDDPAVIVRLLATEGLGESARAGLRHLADLRAAEVARRRDHDQVLARITALDSDEARIRQNLGAVQPNDALRGKLVRQLEAAEEEYAQLRRAAETAKAAVDTAHQALADAVRNLRL